MCEVCEAARRTWGSVEGGMQVWRCCGYALHAWLQRIVRLPRAGAVPRGVREMGVHTARAACPCFRLVRRPSLGAADAAWAGSAAEVVADAWVQSPSAGTAVACGMYGSTLPKA